MAGYRVFHPGNGGGMLAGMLWSTEAGVPLRALQGAVRARRRQAPAQSAGKAGPDTHRQWCCRACNLPVTSEAERLSVGGTALHRRRNPLGIEYEFACFAQAPGCRHTGPDSGEHTWFAGYRWKVALCAGCHTHLGWRFRDAGHQFHGLIIDRLRAVDSRGLH